MEGLAKLGFSLPTLIAQIIQFVILLCVLYLILYRFILPNIDERSRRIKEGLEQSEAMKQKAAAADDEIKKRLDAVAAQGQERIERATRIADEVRQKGNEQARQEAEALLNRARLEIQQERDEALGSLRREFAELTVLAAGKVIERALDKEQHRALIDKVLEEGLAQKEN